MAASELTIGSLTLSTGGLLGAVVILLFTWLIARLVRFLLAEEMVPRLRLRRGSGQSLVTLVNYSIFGIGVMMAASAMGLTGTQLAVVVGALSVGIGFGLQTIVNNFVSGLILIFERPIMVGDTVQTVDHFGKVERIGIRASTIRSFDGAEIIVPNGDLISKEVVNWTRSDEIRRVDVLVGVAYGTDPETVLEILLRVATEHAKVRETPGPKAQMIGFGDSSLDFRLRCWTTVEDWVDVASDVHVAINRELKAAGVTIPFPQRDLHVIPRAGEGAPEAPPQLDTADHPPLPDSRPMPAGSEPPE
jgi:small-conductance mechanosensitive channel